METKYKWICNFCEKESEITVEDEYELNRCIQKCSSCERLFNFKMTSLSKNTGRVACYPKLSVINQDVFEPLKVS